MDTRSGKIVDDIGKNGKELLRHFVEVNKEDMTEKQREEKKVSLHDHTSKLGKRLTQERRSRGLTYNRYRKLKRQGKLR